MPDKIELMAPCHFGMEAVLKKEIFDLGYDVTKVVDGRVYFEGDIEAICYSNVFLRTAERILVNVGEFKAETFEELFQGTKAIDNVESGLKPGGTLILVIEAREGGGPAEYFGWSRDLTAGTLEKRLREAFTVAGYIFFLNCEQARRYDIYLLTSIPPEVVAPMGLKAFNNMGALLRAANLAGKSLYVIPNGGTVIPFVEENA